MSFTLHASPIYFTEGGKFEFQTFSPAEGQLSTHTYDVLSRAATARGAMRLGIKQAGGTFRSHPTKTTFRRVVKDHQP